MSDALNCELDPNSINKRVVWVFYLFIHLFRSKVYMVDLESALHYLLRVELATHKTLEGVDLKTFKNFVTVVAKVGPINIQVCNFVHGELY